MTTTNTANIAADLAACDARIAHLDWWIANAPAGIDRSWAITERDILKGQTRGNLLIDLRSAVAAL